MVASEIDTGDLFRQGERSVSPVRSVVGDVADEASAGGFFRQDRKAAELVGRRPVGYDSRKFKYNVTAGRGAKLEFSVTRDDRMSAEEAGDALHRIHQLLGVEAANEGVLRAVDKAIMFSHTVNGASTLAPGRAKFKVEGSEEFSSTVIRDFLGVDNRRFFRAYADEITQVNREVLRDYDPYDAVKSEQHGWLMQVAYERGLHRYPHLAHDSADACNSLSPTERAALAASKTMVIGSTANSADRLRVNSRVASADRYDSTVGESY